MLPPDVTSVLRSFGLPSDGARAARAESGLIQITWIVELRDGRRVVVQRLHPVFAPEVNEDIEAVTLHLEARGMTTPRLLRTPAGRLWVELAEEPGGRPWRVQTFLEGTTVDAVERPAQAAEAGRLVGEFHLALSDLVHDFLFVRAGVHDTAAHLERLERALDAHGDPPGEPGLAALAEAILEAARGLPALGDLPRRNTHGDLKISNVLFARDASARALALIDLDTVGRQTLAYELGDAWRSWCNPRGEDAEQAALDLEILDAAAAGYAAGSAGLLVPEERDSLIAGIETICVELAARFCLDAYEDRYFGWDKARFPSRRAHNRVRAAGQLALARSVWDRRSQAERIVHQRL